MHAHFVHYDAPCDYTLETGHHDGLTNWAWLVSEVLDQKRLDGGARTFFAGPGLPRPVTRPGNWHRHGLNFSCAWGL